MPELTEMYGSDDPITARKEFLDKMKIVEGETPFKPSRIDMTAPDKQNKLRRYARTVNKKFSTQELTTYEPLRAVWWENMQSMGIGLDLLYNYHQHVKFSESGLQSGTNLDHMTLVNRSFRTTLLVCLLQNANVKQE